MKKQIIVIHGGSTFAAYEDYLSFLKNRQIDFEKFKNLRNGWKDNLADRLGKDFEVIFPMMPNKANAKYIEWKIWFEKGIPYFEPEVVLVGHSLGGTFLAKYLAENKFAKKVRATLIVSAPFDTKDREPTKSFADFVLPEKLNKLEEKGGKICLYYSEDDPLVPFVDFEKYRKNLRNAIGKIFADKGHFDSKEFPELIEDIKSLY